MLLWQALVAHERFNCLTEQWINQAIHDAIKADEYFKATGKTKGPLHGLPISLKDTIDVAGVDSTVGIIKKCFKPASQDAVIVEILKKAGAIPFVKSNVPQMISFECSNPLFGRTLNPLNQNFNGGSSGEGCLLTSSGSPAGMGTDMAGSIRITAHSTGICGLKPTGGRFPSKGFVTQVERGCQDAVPGVIGPMGRTVSDLILLTKSVIDGKPWELDVDCPPVPFDNALLHDTRPLRIGFLTSDGVMDPTPPCTRAVAEAVAAMGKAGHVIVPFSIPDATEALELYFGLISADGIQLAKNSLKWEPTERSFRNVFRLSEIPQFLNRTIAFFASFVHPLFGTMIDTFRVKSMSEYWILMKRKNEYREK